MNVLQWGSRVLTRTSPLGLAVGGAAIALSIPAVRKGLRRTTVIALSGIITATDEAKRLSIQYRQKLHALIDEAKNTEDGKNSCGELAEKLRSQPRRLAVSATAGVLAVSDKAKGITNEFKSIVSDAKSLRDQSSSSQGPSDVVDDGLEGNFVELPKQH
ncbi:hypothetical protein HA075_25210 [bacterium BFN5]|nr:hypothetical protein HA075_25210 [bacterium BFN5]